MNEQLERILSLMLSFVSKYLWFIILGFIAIHFLRRKLNYKKMQTIAQRLGLEFQTFKTIDQKVEEQIQLITTGQGRNQLSPKALQFISSAIDFILPFFSHWKMTGRWNTVSVSVYREVRRRKNNKSYTVVRAETGNSAKLGLLIVSEGFLATIGKAFHNVQDIQTGNERLDKKIIVKAKDVDRARMVLNNTYLQDAILQAFEFSSSISIDDQSVCFSHAGTLTDEEKLRSALDRVSQTAHALQSAYR